MRTRGASICPTDLCLGDGRYAAPGRGHIDGCTFPIPPAEQATGAIVPERQRCICNDGLCLDHCRACNHSGRDLEEPCIADPDWEPDEEDLAQREGRVLPPAEKGGE